MPEAFHTALTTRILTVYQRETPEKSVKQCQELTSLLIHLQYDPLYYHKQCPQLHVIKYARKVCLNLARNVELMASFTYLYQFDIALHLELFKRGMEEWQITTVSC